MIYQANRGVCWAASTIALIPITAGLVWVGLLVLAAWASFMLKARRP